MSLSNTLNKSLYRSLVRSTWRVSEREKTDDDTITKTFTTQGHIGCSVQKVHLTVPWIQNCVVWNSFKLIPLSQSLYKLCWLCQNTPGSGEVGPAANCHTMAMEGCCGRLMVKCGQTKKLVTVKLWASNYSQRIPAASQQTELFCDSCDMLTDVTKNSFPPKTHEYASQLLKKGSNAASCTLLLLSVLGVFGVTGHSCYEKYGRNSGLQC